MKKNVDVQELIDVHDSIVEMKDAKIQHLIVFLENSVGLIYALMRDGCFDDYDDDFVKRVDGMLQNMMHVIEMEKGNQSTKQ